MTDKPRFDLDAAIKSINHHESKMAWLRRGRLLASAHKNYSWTTRGEGTFGHMLAELAKTQAVHPGVLWRDIKAARYLDEKLRPTLEAEGICVPSDEDLPTGVNTEVLDLLERVERVVPRDEFIKQAKIVISGKMVRQAFRSYWNAVKPALGGRSARGRSGHPEVEDREARFFEQRILARLVEQGSQWLNGKHGPEWPNGSHPCGYELVLDESTLTVCRQACGGCTPEAIAVVQPSTDPRIELHGVKVISALTEHEKPVFLNALKAFDRFWLISYHAPDLAWLAEHRIPEWVGLIRVEEKVIKTINDDESTQTIVFDHVREAGLNHPNTSTICAPSQRQRLLEALYSQTIKHF